MGWERQPEISGLELSCGMPIDHTRCFACIVASPQGSQNLSTLMLVTKHEATSYMTSCIILTLLLCGMNISPFLWRGEESLFHGSTKYRTVSVVKISSWQVTRIYRREKNSLKLVSPWCGFFASLLIAFILISSSEFKQLSLSL